MSPKAKRYHALIRDFIGEKRQLLSASDDRELIAELEADLEGYNMAFDEEDNDEDED